jgi:hypothetical protein
MRTRPALRASREALLIRARPSKVRRSDGR